MEDIAILLAAIFMLGFSAGVILLIISLIKRNFRFTKKGILKYLLICFIGFIGSTIFYACVETPETKARLEQQRIEREEAKKIKQQEEEEAERIKQQEKDKEEAEKAEEEKNKDSESEKESADQKTEEIKEEVEDTISTGEQEDKSVEQELSNTEEKAEYNAEYDELQKLYLNINSDMSFDEALNVVQQSGLPNTVHNYNGSKSIKAAFEEGVLPSSHADSGDYIEISFDENRTDKSLLFSHIEYFNNSKFMTLFEYKNGHYWDFGSAKDAGLYINNHKQSMGKKEEKYIKVNSKEEQLEYLDDYSK